MVCDTARAAPSKKPLAALLKIGPDLRQSRREPNGVARIPLLQAPADIRESFGPDGHERRGNQLGLDRWRPHLRRAQWCAHKPDGLAVGPRPRAPRSSTRASDGSNRCRKGCHGRRRGFPGSPPASRAPRRSNPGGPPRNYLDQPRMSIEWVRTRSPAGAIRWVRGRRPSCQSRARTSARSECSGTRQSCFGDRPGACRRIRPIAFRLAERFARDPERLATPSLPQLRSKLYSPATWVRCWRHLRKGGGERDADRVSPVPPLDRPLIDARDVATLKDLVRQSSAEHRRTGEGGLGERRHLSQVGLWRRGGTTSGARVQLAPAGRICGRTTH